MHRIGLATGVVVLTMVLSSCGSAEPETSETATSAQRGAGTFQMEMAIESESLEFDATGATRYPDSEEAPELSMTMNLPPEQGGEIEMVVIDETAYLRLPPDAGLPTPWLKIQSDGSDPVSAQMAPLIAQMTSSTDFEQYFETFEAASSIEHGDADVIDGVDVTEYVVTVDVSKMPADALAGGCAGGRAVRRGDLFAVGRRRRPGPSYQQ
jgi:hypothetical protein